MTTVRAFTAATLSMRRSCAGWQPQVRAVVPFALGALGQAREQEHGSGCRREASRLLGEPECGRRVVVEGVAGRELDPVPRSRGPGSRAERRSESSRPWSCRHPGCAGCGRARRSRRLTRRRVPSGSTTAVVLEQHDGLPRSLARELVVRVLVHRLAPVGAGDLRASTRATAASSAASGNESRPRWHRRSPSRCRPAGRASRGRAPASSAGTRASTAPQSEITAPSNPTRHAAHR